MTRNEFQNVNESRGGDNVAAGTHATAHQGVCVWGKERYIVCECIFTREREMRKEALIILLHALMGVCVREIYIYRVWERDSVCVCVCIIGRASEMRAEEVILLLEAIMQLHTRECVQLFECVWGSEIYFVWRIEIVSACVCMREREMKR